MRILVGDALARLRELPDESVNCCVSSPAYWAQRDYGVEGQMGLEATPSCGRAECGKCYVCRLVEVFEEVRRVLRGDGTAWVVLGDTYAQAGGPGWQGKNGQRADRRFTAVRDAVAMRECTRRPSPGVKVKDLIGIPWMVAFALRDAGWWLRSDIIYAKTNCIPESVKDRPTHSHEYVFLLAKSERYHFDSAAFAEPAVYGDHRRNRNGCEVHAPGQACQSGLTKLRRDGGPGKGRAKNECSGDRRPSGLNERWNEAEANGEIGFMRNRRTVWTIPAQPTRREHFAAFPEALVHPCIAAGCPPGGTVLDPFFGTGTVGVVAAKLGRDCIGIELNPKYAEMARARIVEEAGVLTQVEMKP